MEMMFTWRGRSFGYKDGENLWTYSGKHVGRFHCDEVYGSDGRYLGEMKNDKLITKYQDKLITKTTKKSRRKSAFTPRMNRMRRAKIVNRVGTVMLVGHEDFPEIDGC